MHRAVYTTLPYPTWGGRAVNGNGQGRVNPTGPTHDTTDTAGQLVCTVRTPTDHRASSACRSERHRCFPSSAAPAQAAIPSIPGRRGGEAVPLRIGGLLTAMRGWPRTLADTWLSPP